MANKMASALNKKLDVTKKAFERVRTQSGKETYRPLEIYTKLTPEDFTAISDRYGIDNTIQYIKNMEGLRMRGKK